ASPILLAGAAAGRERRLQPRRLRLGPLPPGRTADRQTPAVRPRGGLPAGGDRMSTLLAEDVEMTLDADGWAWTRRADGWAAPSAGEVTREIRVTPTDSGIRLDAVLIEWDEAAAESREALALFLKIAGRDVPGVGCSLDGTLARLRADVPAEQIENRLG